MVIFVDDGYKHLKLGRMKMSHMMSDTGEAELHLMAERIGMKREWFQGDHYDVSLVKRAYAIQLGAVECTSRDLVRIRRLARVRIG